MKTQGFVPEKGTNLSEVVIAAVVDDVVHTKHGLAPTGPIISSDQQANLPKVTFRPPGRRQAVPGQDYPTVGA